VDSTDPIERGFKVGPLRRQFKVVEPVHNQREIEGVVITTLRPIKMVSADTLIFIDRGDKDGVTVATASTSPAAGTATSPCSRVGPSTIDGFRAR